MDKNIFSWFKGTILSPAQTFREIIPARPIAWSIIIYAVSSVLFNMGADNLDPQTVFRFNAQFFAALFVELIITIIVFFILTFLLAYFARIAFGGKGDFWGLFCLTGFASIPYFLAGLIVLVMRSASLVALYFGALVIVAAFIWAIVLYVIAIRESQELSTAASIGLLISYFVIIIIVVFIFVYALLPFFF